MDKLSHCAALVFVAPVLMLAGCDSPAESPSLVLPVYSDSSGLAPATTDLGYVVQVTSVELSLSGIVFTVEGEVHVVQTALSAWSLLRLGEWLVPSAWAHPGHAQAGEVTGELGGERTVRWQLGAEPDYLGDATLLEGRYEGADFAFSTAALAGASSSADAADPLEGLTMRIFGTASRDGESWPFEVRIVAPADRELIGAPFVQDVRQGMGGRLVFQFVSTDPFEGDTAFDAVPFAELADADGTVRLEDRSGTAASTGDGTGDRTGQNTGAVSQEAFFAIRRSVLSHDHYLFSWRID